MLVSSESSHTFILPFLLLELTDWLRIYGMAVLK
jgi:hypothetical protein